MRTADEWRERYWHSGQGIPEIVREIQTEYEAAVIKAVAKLYRGVTLPVLGNVMVAIKSLRESEV